MTIALKDWSALLGRQIEAIPTEVEMMLPRIGEALSERAKQKIGHYQKDWAALKPATVRGKERRGFAPPDNPLLRSGEMRDSIDPGDVAGMTLVWGATDVVAAYQERGTERGIPARPFIGSTMQEGQPMIVRMLGLALGRALSRMR